MRNKAVLYGIALFFLLTFIPFNAFSALPSTISYQGYLSDSNGDAVDSTGNITFSIYDAETGGTALWSESQSVTVSNGVFSVILGNSTSISLDFDTQYYIGMTIEGNSEMSPRLALTMSAYAFRASVADSVSLTGSGSTIDTESLTASRALVSNASQKVAVSSVTETELGYVSGVTSAIQTQLDSKGTGSGDVTTTGTQTLTNKTLTTPVISSISNTGTLTLPTSTDTLVGRATTDTLTNKTLTTPTITGVTDASSAASGDAGEVKACSVVAGDIATTKSVVVSLCSISLTAGDWDVYAQAGWNKAGYAQLVTVSVGINTADATLGTLGTNFFYFGVTSNRATGAGSFFKRVNISSTTTYYLTFEFQAGDAVEDGNSNAYGNMTARRVR